MGRKPLGDSILISATSAIDAAAPEPEFELLLTRHNAGELGIMTSALLLQQGVEGVKIWMRKDDSVDLRATDFADKRNSQPQGGLNVPIIRLQNTLYYA